jgi:hypothetical protein
MPTGRQAGQMSSYELISKSLPLFDQIGELEQNQKIAPELAEIIRRKITSGIAGFLETGCLIPEIKPRVAFDPVHLLAAKETLLLPAPEKSPKGGPSAAAGAVSNDGDERRNLSAEDQAQLEAILRKMRGSTS